MEIFDSILFYRGLERILIILFSGLSLILGWHLFKVGIHPEQHAEIKTGKTLIKLTKVGPGIFFALFGASVFIYSLASPIQYMSHNEDKEGHKVSVSYLTQDQRKYLELSKSINTLKDISTGFPPGFIPINDSKLFNTALHHLEKERAAWVVTMFGSGNYIEWEKSGDSFLINPENIKREYRETFEQMRPWMANTLADR